MTAIKLLSNPRRLREPPNYYLMRLIEIISYQDRWPHEFEKIKADLERGLGDLALRIDHIGSTSVVGLGAKDIIDVQVTVASLDPVQSLTEGFQNVGGYQLRDALFEDHRPLGDDRPPHHWQKRYAREPEGKKRTHIHIRAAGSANQRYALLFRDFLRSEPRARANYEKLKQELARLHPHDIDAYLAVKEPAIDIIMIAAEAWATSSGWNVLSFSG
jgi:GrpB-like predicted nucleotidyltransferase (UPF0157 family)